MMQTHFCPAGELRNQFEALKGQILTPYNGKFRPPLVLAFTSSERGEGVTHVAASFAGALAEEGERRVILVDANLSSPSVAALLGPDAQRRALPLSKNGNGLSSLPWQGVRASRNLDILVSFTPTENPAAILGTKKFAELLDRLKEKYDIVVLDCPPVSSGGAAALAARADWAVLVVEAGRTRREIVGRVVSVLESAGANLLGVVLNKRKRPIPKWIYDRL